MSLSINRWICIAALFFATASRAEEGGKFTLSSADLKPGKPVATAQILDTFGCSGENQSPALSWSHPPAGTRSFVLTVYDPDAPTGSGWWHWVVLDIPATTTSLPTAIGKSGTLPAGARESRTDMGRPGYMGFCPPKGDKPHRYVFTLHALKVEKLAVADDATPALVGFNLNANRIGQASFTVKHGR